MFCMSELYFFKYMTNAIYNAEKKVYTHISKKYLKKGRWFFGRFGKRPGGRA